jgi:hypothetical protein
MILLILLSRLFIRCRLKNEGKDADRYPGQLSAATGKIHFTFKGQVHIGKIIEIFEIIPWIYYRNSVSDLKSLSLQCKDMLHSPCSHSPEEAHAACLYIVGRNLLKL